MECKVIIKEGRHSFVRYCGSNMLDAEKAYQQVAEHCAKRVSELNVNINVSISMLVDCKLYKSTSITSKTKAV